MTVSMDAWVEFCCDGRLLVDDGPVQADRPMSFSRSLSMAAGGGRAGGGVDEAIGSCTTEEARQIFEDVTGAAAAGSVNSRLGRAEFYAAMVQVRRAQEDMCWAQLIIIHHPLCPLGCPSSPPIVLLPSDLVAIYQVAFKSFVASGALSGAGGAVQVL